MKHSNTLGTEQHRAVYDRVIAILGSQTALAQQLGCTQQAVCNWRKSEFPIRHCALIEALTGGEVTRRELRPHDWWHVWPELVRNPYVPPCPPPSVDAVGCAA